MGHWRAGALRWIVPLVGLALLAVLFLQLGPARILSLVGSIGWRFAILVGIFACHECVRALALSRCLRPADRPPFHRLLWIRFVGELVRTLTHTGPFVSEPARAWMLARQGLRGAHAYGAAISELIANSGVSALVTVLVLGYVLASFELSRQLTVLSQVLVSISFAYVTVAVVALARRIYLIGAIAKGAGALPIVGPRLRSDPLQVRSLEDAIMHALRDRPATSAQVVLLEFAAQAILVLEVYWAIRSMGLPVSAGRALVVEALTKLANVVQVVGATEGGYALVFTWLGMGAAAGFTLSLVKRVRSLAVAALGLGILMQIGRSSWTQAADPDRTPRSG